MSYLHVFMSGERVTAESAEAGDFEESGYVDPKWSMTEFQDRNNAGTVLSVSMSDPDLPDMVRDVLADLGAYEDNGDGTFYGRDGHQDFVTGDSYSYALHFVHKSYDASGRYVERPWHPAEAGISLTQEG